MKTKQKSKLIITKKKRSFFFSNKTNYLLRDLIKKEFSLAFDFFEKVEDFYISQDIPNPPSKQFSHFLKNLAIKTTAKFAINPSLSEAPSNLLSTLSSKLLDFSVVRAEVALLCYDTLLNILLPVHVFLLSNNEQDFTVMPPSIKTLVKTLRKRQYKFKRRYIFRTRRLVRRVKKFHRRFYLSSIQFFRFITKRFLAIDVIEDGKLEHDSFKLFHKLIRVEVGTLRSIKCGIIKLI